MTPPQDVQTPHQLSELLTAPVEIVATATRNGGFPPLMLEPVDFASLYRDRMAAQQANKPAIPS